MKDHLIPARPPHPIPNCDGEAATITTLHTNRRALSITNRAIGLLVFVSFVLQPVAAVLLSDWQNCLDDSIRFSEPRQLQWVPLYVGATFERINTTTRTLRVTVWGNVTGSYEGVSLPAWNDPVWSNDNFTDGKIVANPFSSTANHLTTLYTKIDVLTYEPYSNNSDFCKDSLANRSCPLGPVFNTTEM